MNEIEEIKSRLDLVDFIGQYVSLKKAGVNYKAVCPFHQEKTPSFMVSPEKQIWKCFGCGRGGDIFKFVMERESLEFADALRLLAQRAGVTLKPRTAAEHQSQSNKERLFALNRLVAAIFAKVLEESQAGKQAREYLEKRGIKAEVISRFQLGFAAPQIKILPLVIKRGFTANDLARIGHPEKFFQRIIFPITDVLGNVVGFTGRALGDNEPKYLNSPETPIYNKSRVLYGLNLARKAIKQLDQVVLVEGQMDVIALHQAGVEQAVASSGTAITEIQIQTLAKYTNNFLLAFDNDAAGRATTKKVIEMLLRSDLNGRVVSFGEYKDAGEMMVEKPAIWPSTVKEAKEIFEWILEEELAAAGQVDFVENKKKILKAILPLLALVSEPTRLDHYVQKTAMTLRVKPETVYASLKRVTQTKTETINRLPEEGLSAEEQLLSLLLAYPETLNGKYDLSHFYWTSELLSKIAKALQNCYNDHALVENSLLLRDRVKKFLTPPEAEKIDVWQISLTRLWPQLDRQLAKEMVEELLNRFARRDFERSKEDIAVEIRRAQESGDFARMKKLMTKLNQLAQEAPPRYREDNK